MSMRGTWMVLYRSDAIPSPEALLSELRAAPGLTVEMPADPQDAVIVREERECTPVEVLLRAGPEVARQAVQFAEAFGDLHPEQALIAACNRRFELRWDARADVVGTVCLIAERLARVAGAPTWILDAEAGEFLLFV